MNGTQDLPIDGTEFEGELEPGRELQRRPVHRRRPAETATFAAGLAALAAYVGLDLPEGAVVAGLAVVSGLPAIVTTIVTAVRESAAPFRE